MRAQALIDIPHANTEDKLQEYIALLKEAGMDKILSETKSQLAEFMAAN